MFDSHCRAFCMRSIHSHMPSGPRGLRHHFQRQMSNEQWTRRGWLHASCWHGVEVRAFDVAQQCMPHTVRRVNYRLTTLCDADAESQQGLVVKFWKIRRDRPGTLHERQSMIQAYPRARKKGMEQYICATMGDAART